MDLATLLGQPPDPVLAAAQEEYQRAVIAFQVEARETLVRFAPVACSCPRRYSWTEPMPPQMGCVVHGQLVMTPEGRLIT